MLDKIGKLAVEMALQNRSWGYARIQGASSNLGLCSAKNRSGAKQPPFPGDNVMQAAENRF
jgi:hypothetical protein